LQGQTLMAREATIEKLASELKAFSVKYNANAAVALLLTIVGSGFEVLLVKRACRLTDLWSGQMALPGGKRDRKDANLHETVVREVYEETGVRLDRNSSRFLGVLTVQNSIASPNMNVLPFVYLLPSKPAITLNLAELESYFWVNVEALTSCKTRITRGDFGQVDAYVLKDAEVWGLTCRILNEFLSILQVAKKP
jgi:8-oxo-dGTP pyrophosphatase MutT (NUDIX family)